MCGITGTIDATLATGDDELRRRVTNMAASLRHRGPDAAGEWTDAATGVALGFRRLSIIDLSPTGNQPMVSASGRYVLVFNGEVYNYRELRATLESAGARFRGTSDTEVLLEWIDRHGIDSALRRANAMFALAVWDRERRVLTLARDRFGEKPLFYGWMGQAFLFGSELKALRRHPGYAADVDRAALAQYLRYGYVPAPRSILHQVAKVPPGCMVEVSPDHPGEAGEPAPYWSLFDVAEAGAGDPVRGDPEDAVVAMEELLGRSVQARMVADVPLGAFLSGGIDSSTVVALMQAHSDRPVRTFTIGFEEFGFNEAEHAKRVAAHLGTYHTELYLTAADALAVVPRLPEMYDEPFGDSSQIPTHLVARLARRHVTVALSGDGGDEVFAGYNRHIFHSTQRRLQRLPRPLRRVAGRVLGALPAERWDALAARLTPVLPPRLRGSPIGDKLHKVARVLPLDDPREFLRDAVSQWHDPSSAVVGGTEPASLVASRRDWGRLTDPTFQLVYLDTMTYLPDDILAKVDRATMAVSLEARVPYLDPEVVAYAWRIPLEWKIRGGRGKWLLRRVLDRHVPEDLVLRPKAGFAVPFGAWLRGPLRPWAEDLLAADRLAADGLLDVPTVRAAWQDHVSERRDRKEELWTVLMFQAWLAENTP